MRLTASSNGRLAEAPARLKALVREVFSREMNVDVPSTETDLFETGLLDSLTFVDLLVRLEEEFSLKLRLDEIDLESFRSIDRVVEMLQEKVAARVGTELEPAK
jgi:methoxymalonate biosynthesis acyl carrier protein